MSATDTTQDLSQLQDTFREGLEAHGWFLPTLGDGVTGLGPQAEDVVQGLAAAARKVAARLSPDAGPRRVRVPRRLLPATARDHLRVRGRQQGPP